MQPLDIPRLHHIGVVVRDVVGSVGRHASVFDVDRWNFINWRRQPGRLETPFYRGTPVNHEYLTGRAFDFQGFGFDKRHLPIGRIVFVRWLRRVARKRAVAGMVAIAHEAGTGDGFSTFDLLHRASFGGADEDGFQRALEHDLHSDYSLTDSCCM
jgi:hypothetical protein